MFVPFFTACPPDQPDPIDPDIDDMPITSVAALTAPDAERLEGRDVELFGVRIVEVRADTAFYVTDDMPPAPDVADPQMDADAQADPGATPADPGAMQPMQPADTDRRVLVRYDTGILGLDVTGDQDLIRVGAMVDVFGTVGVRDDAMPRQPAPMEDDMQDPAMQDDPAMQQPTPTPSPGVDRVFVDADRVERADATGRAPGQPGAPGDTGPDQTGDAY